MKKPTIFKAGIVLCILVMLNACQKEISTPSNQEDQSVRSYGAVKDDPALVSKVPVIISSSFSNNAIAISPSSNSRKKPQGSTADGTPPSVNITSPVNGATVSGTLTVSVNATDNVGVSSVSLSVDGTFLANSTVSPYNFSWNTSTLADGTHTLTVQARDAAGNTSSSSITVAKNTMVTVLSPSSTPSSFSLLMPPVGYQGGEFSCVAFAAGYAARSAEQFYRTNASGYSFSSNIFSPEFLYDQTKFGDCGSGTSIIKALEFMKTTGICTWQTMPYSYTNGCSLVPSGSQLSEAANYRIPSYSFVYKSDITAIKTLLNNKHPLVIMVVLDNSFTNAQPGFIWKSYSGSGGFNHALTICGYDDTKHAWKVMSSWGTGWGDSGYSWIDYDFLPQTGDLGAYVMNY